MARGRSIRDRRRRGRLGHGFELQLTSLMDILVILVVFLLKSYQTSLNDFAPVPGIQLPVSVSPDVPLDSLYVIITPEAITFENARVLEFPASDLSSEGPVKYVFRKGELDDGGRRIRPLYDALVVARDKSEQLRSKSQARDAEGNPLPFDGILAIQADKRVDYETVRKIMYTAATAGFKTFRFLAMKKEE